MSLTTARGLRMETSRLIGTDAGLATLALLFPHAEDAVEQELRIRYPVADSPAELAELEPYAFPTPVDLSPWDATAELEPMVYPDAYAELEPWQHLWPTKRVALEAARAEHAELVRLADEAAELATSGYEGDLEEYWERNARPVTLTDYLRSYGLVAELAPRVNRSGQRVLSRAERNARLRAATKRSHANRTADRRDARNAR